MDKATKSVDAATNANADARAVRLLRERLPTVCRGGVMVALGRMKLYEDFAVTSGASGSLNCQQFATGGSLGNPEGPARAPIQSTARLARAAE